MPSAPPAASHLRAGVATLGLLLCVAVVLWLTLSPTPVDRGYESAIGVFLDALHRHGVPGWFGYRKLEFSANVLLFWPLGFLTALALPWRSTWLALLVVLAISASVEWAQWAFLSARAPSGLDVLANTLGGGAGAAAAWVLRALVHARDRQVAAAACAQARSAGGGAAWPAS